MSCEQSDRVLEAYLGAGLSSFGAAAGSPGDESSLLGHLEGCSECADLIGLSETLRGAAGAFSVPEPHPSYWVRFSEKVSDRLRAADAAVARNPSWQARFALGMAVCSLMLASLVAIDPRGSVGLSREASPSSRSMEAALLKKLDQLPAEKLAEVLDDWMPVEGLARPDDLTGLEDYGPELIQGIDPGVSPFELYQELGAEERSRLLEEIRGEMG